MSEQVSELLASVELFKELDDDALAVLAAAATRVQIGTGETLFRRGDSGDAMFLVAEGTVRVHDERSVFNTVSARETFGEFALIDSVTRSASVTATEPCVLYAIEREAFLSLLATNFAMTRAILRSLIRQVTEQKDRSEALLQHMLPREIAEEYKQKGSVDVRRHEQVTILFSDFEGFTRVSADASPEWVIAELDHCFSAFDRITDRYGVLKHKTTGDGYMCVGGLLQAHPAHSVDVVLVALEMQHFMREREREHRDRGIDYWTCRVGVNTGSCFSAVIGDSKLTFDVWSDAVNMASRLETAGSAGRVNVGESTYRLVRDFFRCESRGEHEVKHGRKIPMYFVDALRGELSADCHGVEPNAEFFRMRRVHFE